MEKINTDYKQRTWENMRPTFSRWANRDMPNQNFKNETCDLQAIQQDSTTSI